MFLFTSYSVFFITEIRYRLYFILISFFLLFLYIGTFLNYFLIDVLEPIEYMNLDWSTSFMYKYLFEFIKYINTDIFLSVKHVIVLNTYHVTNNVSDHYPVFEVNISQNSYLYFYLLCYLSASFMLPMLMYHIYLFLVPGLFLYELRTAQIRIFQFMFFYFFFIFFIKKIILIFFLNVTYNNYYEFLNYEFDFVFDIYAYVVCNVYITCLYIFYCLLYLSMYKKNNFFILYFFVINIILYHSFFINFFFVFLFVFFCYVTTFYKYI